MLPISTLRELLSLSSDVSNCSESTITITTSSRESREKSRSLNDLSSKVLLGKASDKSVTLQDVAVRLENIIADISYIKVSTAVIYLSLHLATYCII